MSAYIFAVVFNFGLLCVFYQNIKCTYFHNFSIPMNESLKFWFSISSLDFFRGSKGCLSNGKWLCIESNEYFLVNSNLI